MTIDNPNRADRNQAQDMREEVADAVQQGQQDVISAMHADELGGSYSTVDYDSISSAGDVDWTGTSYVDKNNKSKGGFGWQGEGGTDEQKSAVSGMHAHDNGVHGDGVIFLAGKQQNVNKTSFTMALADDAFKAQNKIKGALETQKFEKEAKNAANGALQ